MKTWILLLAAFAQDSNDFYYPGKRVWAEGSNGWLHSKARVVAVRGDRIEVDIYPHHTHETLESLIDFGRPVERRTFSRDALDWWNRPRYDVIVPFNGRLWPKAQITRQLDADTFEVLTFDADGKPGQKITVSRQDLLRYNMFPYPADGEVVGGITMDYSDPDVQKVLTRMRAITNRYKPLIENETNPIRKADLQKELARELFVEYKKVGIEHDGNMVSGNTGDPRVVAAHKELQAVVDKHLPAIRAAADPASRSKAVEAMEAELEATLKRVNPDGKLDLGDFPNSSTRRSLQASDPSPRSLGAYLRSKVGVCTEQAYVYWGLVARSGAPELGVNFMPYSTVHSEVRVHFSADGSNWNQDLTASRGRPVPGRNFEALSTSGGKPWEVMFHKGDVGLGYSRGISVDRPWSGPDSAIPSNLTLGNPQRVKVNLRGAPAQSRAAGTGSLLRFPAAYLLKEAMKGRFDAYRDFKEAEFWGGLAAFEVASRLAGKLPIQGLARSAVPLAAGMAAMQLLSGNFSLKDFAISTGAYLAAGLLVGAIADSLIYPLLFAAGPPGWIAAGLYTVGKLAVTLYLGEKLEGWLKGLFERKQGNTRGEGFVPKLERLGE